MFKKRAAERQAQAGISQMPIDTRASTGLARVGVQAFLLAAVVFLALAAVLYEGLLRFAAEADRTATARAAADVARQLDLTLQARAQAVRVLAQQEVQLGIMVAGTPSQIVQRQAQLAQVLGAERVVLIPEGAESGLLGVYPRLGYAELDMVQAARESGDLAPIELHASKPGTNHVDVVAVVKTPVEGGVTGYVLASWPGSLIASTLKSAAAGTGARLELLQRDNSGAEHPVQTVGAQAAGATASQVVPGTRWRVVYHSEGGYRTLAGLDWRLMYWSLVVLALLAAALAVMIYRRQTVRLVSGEFDLLAGYVRDRFSGHWMGKDYSPRLRETAPALAVVQNLNWSLLDALPADSYAAVPAEPANDYRNLLFQARESLAVEEDDMPSQSSIAVESASESATANGVARSIFRAYDIRGVVGETLTPSVVRAIGQSFGSEAKAQGEQVVVVGRDGRLSGPELAGALIEGLRASGRDVIDIGVVPTPLVYFGTNYLNSRSGIMVTGSHNPPQYNGLKMVLKGKTLAEQDIQKLYERIRDNAFVSGEGSLRQMELTADYIARVASDAQLARPLRVVVDAGNGVAGAVAPTLLRTLGCEVIELHCDVDGTFPSHHPDPSQPENLKDVIAAVRQHHADLGLAFDGDGDRLGVIDDQGRVLWPDRQIMLYAKDILSANPGGQIIYDVKCSRHLDRVIRAAGGNPLMWKTGHSLVKAKLKETGALLAGEMSGHIFFNDRWFGFDDALYTAARLLEIVAKDKRPTSEIFAELPDAVSTPELRLDLAEGEHFRLIDRLLREAKFPGARLITIDGVRAEFTDGWGLVRASNTTPSLILRFEADNKDALDRIKEIFRRVLLTLDHDLKLPF